jgi:phytoene dehydrogenase-like protein
MRMANGCAYDFVVVGSGPNGLVAGIVLAKAGASVLIVEASDAPGGGCRTAEVTLPGFLHDICSAVYPMGVLSPAFRELGLEQLGVRFVWPDVELAHPLPETEPALLMRSIEATSAALGQDEEPWRELLQPFCRADFIQSLLRPMWFGLDFFWRKARFGPVALRSCKGLVHARFKGVAARALFAGCAAHSMLALDRLGSASFGLVLAAAGHVAGWPVVHGGSQEITRALTRCFVQHGGVLELHRPVSALKQLPLSKAILFDLNPRQVAAICSDALPSSFRDRLLAFRRGPGVFKIDWALDGPIPWSQTACRRAATVHIGGTFEEIAQAEADVAAGRAPTQPFVLLSQPSLFDHTRSPAGKEVAWGYCHVPNGCTEDMTTRIESQIERFAPGFRDCVLARHTMNSPQLERYNPAMRGGDISGGANDLVQSIFRPTVRWNPYSTPNPRIFLCSSSPPPGGGVHGMCGRWAAETALKRVSY